MTGVIYLIHISFNSWLIDMFYTYVCVCLCNEDLDIIRAALTPMSNAQQMATSWLESYFANYGDPAPNRDEIHLLVMNKSDLYRQYTEEMKRLDPGQARIDRARFLQLWAVLFPRCINRPWCDIPGKCDVCYDIDRLKRTSEDSHVQKKLKDAHALHRGGLFMLERRA